MGISETERKEGTMPICKVICSEDKRDDIYELMISQKVMFTVQIVLGVLTLIVSINKNIGDDHQIAYALQLTWNCLEILFSMGGIIVFHILKRPIVIIYLVLMAVHIVLR